MKILCLGGSFTGRAFHRLALETGDSVCIVTRRAGDAMFRGLDARSAEDASLEAEVFDLIVDCVPATSASGVVHPYARLIEAARERGRGGLVTFVHVSSTSVYPDGVGPGEALPYFDEDTPPAPAAERAQRRLDLEENLRLRFPGTRIVRASGIYGPGRSLAERFAAGDFARAGDDNRMVSRIHVIDLCRIIRATALARGGPEIINAVDDRPSLNTETFGYLEHLLDIRIPGGWRDAAPAGRGIRSLYRDKLLDRGLRFPSFEEGFRDCLESRDLEA